MTCRLPYYILYQYRAVVDKFLLVDLLLLVREKGPQEYIAYEFALTSPSVSRMSCSSCAIAVNLFLHTLGQRPCGASIQQY